MRVEGWNLGFLLEFSQDILRNVWLDIIFSFLCYRLSTLETAKTILISVLSMTQDVTDFLKDFCESGEDIVDL